MSILNDEDQVITPDNEEEKQDKAGETPLEEEKIKSDSAIVDVRDELIKTRAESERNKAFAKLRMKEKEFTTLAGKVKELEEKIKEKEEYNEPTEKLEANVDELYERFKLKLEKEKREEKERAEKAKAFILEKEKELKEKGLNKSEVKTVMEYSLEFTNGDIDKAYKLYKEINKGKEKPKTNIPNEVTPTNSGEGKKQIDYSKISWQDLIKM